MSKVVEANAIEFNQEQKKQDKTRNRNNFQDQSGTSSSNAGDINQRKYYEALVGEACNDPFSCPSCGGVLNDPVTIACGHTVCRQHVMSNTANPSLCLKCKAPWRREEPRLIVSENGELKRQQSSPEEDLKNIATNPLIQGLVRKYWSNDLTVMELRNKANRKYGSGQYTEALQLYNRAFNMAPNDHLVLSNRSITNLKSGDIKAALEDAEMAVNLRPDWAKGHLRRGNALKMLGRHDEAFKALFSCLVLEKNIKSQKPVKQELAKELHQLLKMSYSPIPHNKGLDSKASSSSPTSSTGSVDSLSVLDTFRTVDLPACLRELGAYLDKICDQSNDNLENGDNNQENTTNATIA